MAVNIDLEAWRDFVCTEIKKRSLSDREFAEKIGVVNSTISRITNPKQKTPTPGLELIGRVAEFTNTDIRAIVALLVPSATRVNPLAALFAEAASNLPAEQQDILSNLLKGWGIAIPEHEGTAKKD
jgi:transcriptional regulator with XRE-family HTH domain